MGDQRDSDDVTPRTPDIQPHARDATGPIVRVLESEPTQADYALAQRLRDSRGDPYTALARLSRAVAQREADSAERVETQLGAALKKQEGEVAALRAEVADLKNKASTASWIVKGILAAASLFAVYVLERVVTRVERDGEQTVQMLWIKARLDNLERAPTKP